MKRVILDSNIYGRIFESKDYEFIITKKSGLIIFGSVVIRKELRDTDSGAKIEHNEQVRKLRILLLSLYDSIVEDRNLGVTPAIEKLAGQYYTVYKKFGGKSDFKQMVEDFTIVATASLNNLEVIYSDDKKTMLSKEALDSYRLVNDLHDLSLPVLKNYKEFKIELARGEKGWN